VRPWPRLATTPTGTSFFGPVNRHRSIRCRIAADGDSQPHRRPIDRGIRTGQLLRGHRYAHRPPVSRRRREGADAALMCPQWPSAPIAHQPSPESREKLILDLTPPGGAAQLGGLGLPPCSAPTLPCHQCGSASSSTRTLSVHMVRHGNGSGKQAHRTGLAAPGAGD